MKEIKDYLHLYLGCPICLPSSDSQGLNGKLVGILKQSPFDIWQIEMPDGAVVDTEEGLWNDHHGHVKPILRPLSSMTEEEAMQYCRCFKHLDSSTSVKMKVNRDGSVQMDYYWNKEHNGHIVASRDYSNNSDSFLFLLSKHFDLFGLIEAGLAIDKTNL